MSDRQQLNEMKKFMRIAEDGDDDTDWDAHWAREDGDDERADDLEWDAEFARMDAEPECSYCDDEEPLDGFPCLNCGSKQFVGEGMGSDYRLAEIIGKDGVAELIKDLRNGDVEYNSGYFKKLYFHFLDEYPDEIPVGSRTGRPEDPNHYVLDNLERYHEAEIENYIKQDLQANPIGLGEDENDARGKMCPVCTGQRREGYGNDCPNCDGEGYIEETFSSDYSDVDAVELEVGDQLLYVPGGFTTKILRVADFYAIIEDDIGQEIKVSFAELESGDYKKATGYELSETGWGNMVRTDPDDEDEEPHVIKDRHEERPHTPGQNKLGSGARAAADSRAQAFMFDEDLGHIPQGGGVDPHKFKYDVILKSVGYGSDAVKNVPFAHALKAAEKQLQMFHDISIGGGGDEEDMHIEKTYYRPKIDGQTVELPEWMIKDKITGEIHYLTIQPTKQENEGISLESVVENVLQEYPGQPKDYDAYDEADQREMADDMNDDYEQDEIDPEYEDSELGYRFD